jgi:hypothetical protein
LSGAGYRVFSKGRRLRRRAGVVSHVGALLLPDVAQATGLVEAFDQPVGGRWVRRSAHPPGRMLVDAAVMIADGGEAIADLAVLRNQPGLFGQVASPAACWRVLDSVDADTWGELKQARATARERAWPGAGHGHQLGASAHPHGDTFRMPMSFGSVGFDDHPG